MRPSTSAGQGSVSVLVCAWNQLEHTRRCLELLLAERSPLLHEIVVVDNGSTDETPGYLAELASREPLVRVLSPGENLGFVGGNNLAAPHATGEHLVFLNNDTEPRPGWLEALVDRIEGDATVGAVGAKLVYPDGRLQEAGGIVFSDASGWNYGRGDDPDDPRYRFIREVDYCSGACLLVRREVFERLGRFDERFAPAYYEDTDLCFAIRALGLRVVYEPQAIVVHHEGATAGTDLAQGMKRHQVVNRERFREKWADALTRQYAPDASLVRRASNRAPGTRVLVVDPLMPMYDQASGSRRLSELLRIMARDGHAVTFIARNGYEGDRYGPELERLGVEVYAGDPERLPSQVARRFSIARLMQETGYDVAFLSFYYIAEEYLPLVRENLPRARVVFDTVDVHYVRERREAELRGDEDALQAAEETRERELAMVAAADVTVTVTAEDRAALLADAPGADVVVIPNVHTRAEPGPGVEDRSGLLFVGNFRHPPNVDAVSYLVREVLPLVRSALPDTTLTVVGPEPPAAVTALASPGVEVVGWVPEVEPYLAGARVSVAPLRYGAGMKGKVGEALAHGVPVVTTRVGAEGIADGDPEQAGMLVGDSAEELAAAIVCLSQDDELWRRLADAGPAHVDERYGAAAVSAALDGLLGGERAAAVDADLTSIVILARGELELTQACLGSIGACTPEPYELVLVDNGSEDGTTEWFRELAAVRPDVRVVLNRGNLGFAAGCNQGLALARGGTILLLNNDTVVTPGWLGRMRAVLEREPGVGIVGPVSNRVSGPQLLPDCDYEAGGGLEAFAARVAREHDGVAEPVAKVVGFCLLARREVLDAIGGLDERFGSGNFEDDDLCLRALAAGFEARIARDSFVHHEGSRTFAGAQVDHERAMLRNWAVFKELWGLPAEAPLESGYTLDLERRRAPLYVPVAPLARTHGLTAGRVWVEDPVRVAVERLADARGVSEAEALRDAFVEIAAWSDFNKRYEARCKLVGNVLSRSRYEAPLVLAAAAALLDALDEEPAEPVLLNQAGVLLYGLGEAKAAQRLFAAAKRLTPELPGIDANISAARELAGGGRRPAAVAAPSRETRQLAERALRLAERARPAVARRISLCMIVKDEEELLPRCLAAAGPAVDEIVVVDTGSTDRTVEIAESFGAKVVSFPWNGSFAAARNVSLEHATGEWILWLDADEVLAEGDAPRLRELAARTWREGFYVQFVNHLGDGSHEAFVHTTMRLFRNRPEYRFVGRIHEQHTDAMPLQRAERFEKTEITVDHYGYRAERVVDRDKSERNRALLERVVSEAGPDPFIDYNLGTEYLVADDPGRAVVHLVRAWEAVRQREVGGRQFVPSLGTRLLQAHRLAGDPAAALAALDDVLRVVPGHTDVVREGALAARALGELEAAAELAETCLALGDAPAAYGGAVGAGTFLALGLLASVRSEQGRHDEAEALLERSLRDHPDFRAAAAALADVRGLRAVESLYSAAASGDAARLAALLRDAAELVPAGHREAYRGWLALLAGDTPALGIDGVVVTAGLLDRLLGEQRFDAFEQVAGLWGTSPLPPREQRETLATLYFAHGFADSAAEEWLAAARDEPDARSLYGLARIALDRGLVDDARSLVAEAARLDPSHAEAQGLLTILGGAGSDLAMAS